MKQKKIKVPCLEVCVSYLRVLVCRLYVSVCFGGGFGLKPFLPPEQVCSPHTVLGSTGVEQRTCAMLLTER